MNANLFSYIENIGIERISQLFKYRNTLLLDDILIYAYVKDIINRCKTFYVHDDIIDYIYKCFVLMGGSCSQTAEYLRILDIRKPTKNKINYRINNDDISFTIGKHNYYKDLEINLIAYLLFCEKNYINHDYVEEQITLIKNQNLSK